MATTVKKNAIAQQAGHMFDVANEPLEVLSPITGYEKMPLVSLEEAVKKLISLVPLIQTHAYVAKQRCQNPADGLTQNESASIMLYTMEWSPTDQCLYFVLNTALRSKDRQKLKPWFLYLRLLFNGLFRLPSATKTIFRGVRLNLSEQYKKGETIIWWGFSSCSSDMDVLKSEVFLGNIGPRTMFTIECLGGKDIHNHAYDHTENEFLILPATHFKVKSCLNLGDLNMVHLEEFAPRYPLLHPLSFPLHDKRISPSATISTSENNKMNYENISTTNDHTYQKMKHNQPAVPTVQIDSIPKIVRIADIRDRTRYGLSADKRNSPDEHLMSWTCDDVCQWIKSFGHEYISYLDSFRNDYTDGFRLYNFINDRTLIEFGIQNPTHRQTILDGIQQLRIKML